MPTFILYSAARRVKIFTERTVSHHFQPIWMKKNLLVIKPKDTLLVFRNISKLPLTEIFNKVRLVGRIRVTLNEVMLFRKIGTKFRPLNPSGIKEEKLTATSV